MQTQDRTVTIGGYTFDEKEHLHKLDGKPLTGVTTVLGVIAKPMLIQWAANQACDFASCQIQSEKTYTEDELAIIFKEARVAHRKKKESAGELGTQVHTYIEKLINWAIVANEGFLDIEVIKGATYDFFPQIKHFCNWAIENKVKFLASEKHVYSKEWFVGGIADIICEMDGKILIGDIKTSSGIYSEHFVQGCAYAKMAVENGLQKKFEGVVILNLKKDGTFDHREYYNIEEGTKVFESALNIYRFKEATK